MGRTFSVSTVFRGRDRLSPVFNRMGRSASMFGSMLRANLVSGAISGGLRMLTQGIRTITSEFIDFEGAVISSTAKFADLNRHTEEGRRQIEQLGMVARRVGQTTVFSATEAAQGLDFLAMAGFTAAEAMEALPQVTNLAVVANTDLARATDIASDSLGAFGLEVSDLQRLNDVFARSMTSSNMNMEDMFEAIKKGAPAFTAAGQSMESFNTLMAVMANAGIKGSEAGTSIRNVMLRLAAPTGEAADLLQQLGVQTADAQGNFRDVIDILADFERGLEGMGTQQRSAALSTIFGNRAVTGMTLQLQEGTASLQEFRDSLLQSQGAATTMGGVIGSSLGNRLKAVRSAVIEAGFTFVSAFSDVAGSSIDMLTEMIRNIDLTAMAERVAAFVQRIIDNIPQIVQGVKDMIPVIQEIGGKIMTIIDGLARFFGLFGNLQRSNANTLPALAATAQQRAAQRGISAPNAREAEARATVQFDANLTIEGARFNEANLRTQGAVARVRMQELGAAP